MKVLSLLFCLLLVSRPDCGQDAAEKDLTALAGAWTIAALEVNGIHVPEKKLEGTTLTIKGDQYVVKMKDRTFPNNIKLDPSKNPKEIDMVPAEGDKKDQVHKGIYLIERDSFKICRGLNPDQARPNQFATWPNTNYFVITWKRVK
ncbi:MAG: TIGR03067 domain-containing protein [Gemmataceae bacterium]|nr:TIGR03067 domain-containing protein [Gemmataceae bacterium]